MFFEEDKKFVDLEGLGHFLNKTREEVAVNYVNKENYATGEEINTIFDDGGNEEPV